MHAIFPDLTSLCETHNIRSSSAAMCYKPL
jgi:hypothetical protein